MRSCRDDGVLLRADKPATMLDSALMAAGFKPGTAPMPVDVWATHSQLGPLRWSYVSAFNLAKAFAVYPHDLADHTAQTPLQRFLAWEYDWGSEAVDGMHTQQETSRSALHTVSVTESDPLVLPATGEPHNPATLAVSYYVVAPVLSNGWCFLGETGKLIAASTRRVTRVAEASNTVTNPPLPTSSGREGAATPVASSGVGRRAHRTAATGIEVGLAGVPNETPRVAMPSPTFPIIMRWFLIQIAQNIGNVVQSDKFVRPRCAQRNTPCCDCGPRASTQRAPTQRAARWNTA